MNLNKRLAELLGWTSITDVGGALVGTPPAGTPDCRGQAAAPDWRGNDGDSFKLMVEQKISVEQGVDYVCVTVGKITRYCPLIKVCQKRDQATRQMIVEVVIKKLEAAR